MASPFLSFSSLVALAAINYTIVHSPIVFLVIGILCIHELGHYLAARRYTKKVSLPIFLPLPFIMIGMTRASDLTHFQKTRVALAGPVFGSIAALLAFIINLFARLFSPYLLLFIFLSEIVFNFVGFDGMKYRKYKKLSSI